VKTNCRKKALTFGEFITAAYDACGKRRANAIVRLALKARWVEFCSQCRIVIL